MKKYYLCVDANGKEKLCFSKPYRESFQRSGLFPNTFWTCDTVLDVNVFQNYGVIEQIIGRKLTWRDDPVEITKQKFDEYLKNTLTLKR